MFKKTRGRLTLRERAESSQRASDFYADMAGKPRMPNRLLAELPPKRHRVKRPVDGKPAAPYERDVLVQVIKALRADPRVARVTRNQSGVFQDGNRYIRVGEKGLLDLTVFMKPGLTPAWGEIECKRDARTKPEPHQLARILKIKSEGGFSGWAWSAESALALLPNA